MENKRVFGPVPSRRLGKSVGINNIPPKICSYSCVYCQLGVYSRMKVYRQEYYDPNDLFAEVKKKITYAKMNNEAIDYLTIVPDGEPTLDKNLGKLIDVIKPLGYHVAVITNSTLLNEPSVRNELKNADWISVKVDTVDESIWKQINRPHKNIVFHEMMDGIKAFSQEYDGVLATETMLIKNLNEDVKQVAEFIAGLHPAISYLSIPTRPPALKWVEAPGEQEMNQAYQVFKEFSLTSECLTGHEGNEFACTGNVREDLLSIISVHPMREEAVKEYLKKAHSSFSIIDEMQKEGEITVTEYKNERFYLRKLRITDWKK